MLFPKKQMIQVLVSVVLLSLVSGAVGILCCTLEASDESGQQLISRLDEFKLSGMKLPVEPLKKS